MRSLVIFYTALILILVAPFHVQAQSPKQSNKISILKLNDIEINLQDATDSLTLNIKAPKSTEANIFEIEDPKRVVIDIPSKPVKLNRTIASSHADIVSKIRLGAHPDKIRIVLDIASNSIGYKSKINGALLSVTLFKNTALFDSIPSSTIIPTVAPSPTQTAVIVASPTTLPTLISSPSPTATTLPTNSPLPSITATPTLTPSPDPTTPTAAVVDTVVATSTPTTGKSISAIDFQVEDGASMALIALSERSQFKLTRDRERRYTLFIPSFTLAAPGLSLPHFPPNDIVGFTLIQMTQKDTGVEISIGLDDGMKAVAVNKDNSILIKAVTAGF